MKKKSFREYKIC